MKPARIPAAYDRVRNLIRDGDLLLCRRWRGVSAAKAAWWDDQLFCLEVRALRGAQAVDLSRLVRRHSGRIDVYEVNPDNLWPDYDRQGATRFMLRLCACSHGLGARLWAALRRWPVVRRFARGDRSDPAPERRPLCSGEACAAADRLGGKIDPTPHLADRLTAPADLARSPLYRYRFTLTAGEEP